MGVKLQTAPINVKLYVSSIKTIGLGRIKYLIYDGVAKRMW